MARRVEPDMHQAKRDVILDSVERLLTVQGYESLTIADVIADAGISKGAFYHYFPSKTEVLSALVQRRLDRWEALLLPIASGEGSPTTRLLGVLRALGNAKSDERAFFIGTLRSLYSDENALAYVKTKRSAAARFTPLVATIVTDGVESGAFKADTPLSSARVVVSLLQECADQIGSMLLEITAGHATGVELEALATAYERAVHDVLGVTDGSLKFIDVEQLRSWAGAVS